MVRLSAVIQPVGLPSAPVSIVRRDASAASFAMPSAVDPAGGQQHRAVEQLHIDVMIRRRGRDLGLRRAALLGELRFDPAAGDDQPASFRRGLRGGAQAVKRFAERRRADPVHLGRVGQPGADRVDMRVDQSGNDGAAGEIDHARRGTGQRADVGRAPDRDDAVAAHRQRFGRRRVERDDLAVEKDRVGALRLRGAGEDQQHSSAQHGEGQRRSDRIASYSRCIVQLVSMFISLEPGGLRRATLTCL